MPKIYYPEAHASNGPKTWAGTSKPPLVVSRIVAVGEGNHAMLSDDAITWRRSTGTLPDSNWNWVAYSPSLNTSPTDPLQKGRWVAVGRGSTYLVAYSDDGGDTWTAAGTVPSGFSTIASVAWSEDLGLFVAVGQGGSKNICYSSDGDTWTDATFSNYHFFAVCWSPERGYFCVTGTNSVGTPAAVYSTSGTGFSAWNGGLGTTIGMVDVCWGKESSRFCGVRPNNGSVNDSAEASSHTVNFTNRALSNGQSWNAICWSSDITLPGEGSAGAFVALSADGPDTINTSHAAITWSAQTASADIKWEGICWSSNLQLFIAVAFDSDGSNHNVMTSPDAVNWTSRTGAIVSGTLQTQWNYVAVQD